MGRPRSHEGYCALGGGSCAWVRWRAHPRQEQAVVGGIGTGGVGVGEEVRVELGRRERPAGEHLDH